MISRKNEQSENRHSVEKYHKTRSRATSTYNFFRDFSTLIWQKNGNFPVKIVIHTPQPVYIHMYM